MPLRSTSTVAYEQKHVGSKTAEKNPPTVDDYTG